MAVSFVLDSLPQSTRESIVKELVVSEAAGYLSYNKPLVLYPYIIQNNIAYIPFYYGNQKLKSYPNDKKQFSRRNITFDGPQLRPYQKEVIDISIERLNSVRTCFLAMATGKGKTLTAIYLASRLKLKTLVFLYRSNLFTQWEESILKVMKNAKIQTITSTNSIDNDCDFYFINPINVAKRSIEDFKDIGFLIVDEAHALCSEKFSQSMLYVTPKYCVGLSATSDKNEFVEQVLNLHFGDVRIEVPLYVEHDYYKFCTKIVPTDIRLNAQGHTDWNSVLEFQSTNAERTELIVKVCQFFYQRNILVLCKRKDQTITIYKMLSELKESVDYTTGTKKKYDKDARILVTTFSKSGVGFDHPKLDMLVVASDVQELFAQYFGRCVRREDSSPIVVDFVDDFKILERHFKVRKDYSISVGGKIKDFKLSFPEFFLPPEQVVELVFQ